MVSTRLHPPPLFFQLFLDRYGKVTKMPNNFNIFQNHLRTDTVMNYVGSEEYNAKHAEIYGGSAPVRSLFSQ